ncbi:hypothetical protein Tco_0602080 [Tanacetum coccineum]
MPVLHSFEENKLEYKDEDEVEIKMIGTGMDKEFLEHNLYENDITSIICHNFSLTSNPPVRGRGKDSNCKISYNLKTHSLKTNNNFTQQPLITERSKGYVFSFNHQYGNDNIAEFMSCGVETILPCGKKSLYDSWKIHMELYIENQENRRMILNSVQNGLLVWPTVVEEDGTTRTKRYKELSVVKKLQADCDLKATNIVLQGHPPDVYAIVNHPKVAKEIWDRVKLLMQGTKLSLQEKECKLYDEFDKFSFVKGETLY